MFTITPPFGCDIICRPAHLQPRNTPLRLIWITVFQPLSEMSSGLARNQAPAFFTMTSRRPPSWLTRSTMAFTCSSCRTSSAMENALRPRLRISFSTGSRCSSLRLQIATSAPARANSIAMDLPMPVPPPVTMAVLPSRENGFLVAMDGDDTPADLLRQRDLGLALRDLALDAAPHRHRRERRAVALRAALQLVEQRAGLVQALARRLGRTAHVVVAGPRGLVPRLLEVGDQQHDLVDLAVEVGRPLAARRELGAVGVEHAVEVLGQPAHFLQMVLRPHARVLGRALVARPDRRRERGEQEEDERGAHRFQYSEPVRRRFSGGRRRARPRARARRSRAARAGPPARGSHRWTRGRPAGRPPAARAR